MTLYKCDVSGWMGYEIPACSKDMIDRKQHMLVLLLQSPPEVTEVTKSSRDIKQLQKEGIKSIGKKYGPCIIPHTSYHFWKLMPLFD